MKGRERFQYNVSLKIREEHANKTMAGVGGALWCLKIIRMLLYRSNWLSYNERGRGWRSFVFFFLICYYFDTDSYEKRKNIEINVYSNNGYHNITMNSQRLFNK